MYLVVKLTGYLLLLLLAAGSFAQHSSLLSRFPDASRFARLNIDQGLSQATAMALAQDHAGNIWIGTQNGLNRYDGFEVKVFRPDNLQSLSISDNFVTSIQIDKHDTLWLGTLNGLNRFNPLLGQFEKNQLKTQPARR